MKNKRILCLWSGGLDSTFMIRDLICKGHYVDATYVKILNNVEKTKRELEVINKLKNGITFVNPKTGFESGEFLSVIEVEGMHKFYFNQLPAFLYGLLLQINNAEYKYDCVAIGYVLGDDAISFIKEIKKIWKSFQAITGPLPKLIFPLTKTSKKDIVRNPLMHSLMHEVTWCESIEPLKDNKPCGECTPCKKMIMYGFQEPIKPQRAPRVESKKPIEDNQK